MQEDTRNERDEGGKNLSIGYYIMKVRQEIVLEKYLSYMLINILIFFLWFYAQEVSHIPVALDNWTLV